MSSNYIICAERDSGKTTFARTLIKRGMIEKGIISLSNKDKSEYYALNVETGEWKILLSKNGEGEDSIGPFKINNESFSWANDILSTLDSGSILIDEIGRLELSGKGFAPSLLTLLKKDVALYITVRTPFLKEVVEYFNIEDYKVLNGSSL